MSDLSKRAVIAGLMALPITARAESKASDMIISEVKIYYLDWDVLTRVAINTKQMRDGFYQTYCHIKINDDFVKSLLPILQLDKLAALKEPVHPDVRLVVDLIHGEDVSTYIADRFTLYSSDMSQSHLIDDTFRNFFRERFANV